MLDNWTMEAVLGVVRHVLTTAGGGLITQGFVTSDEWSGAVGAVITLAGVGWSVWHKWQGRTKS